MKIYVVAVIMMLMMFSTRTSASAVQEVEDLALGLLKGAFEKEYDDLKDCIQDGEDAFVHFKNAILLIKNWSVSDLEKALVEIVAGIKDITKELKECKELVDIIQDLEKIAEEFSNPEALIVIVEKNIFWHGFDITKHLISCIENFEKDNFFGAGEDIGIIIHDLIFSKTTKKITNEVILKGFFKKALAKMAVEGLKDNIFDEVVQFVEGFYTKAFNITVNLDTCDSDVDKAWEDIKNAILRMENMTLSDIEQGIADLYRAIPELITAFQDCEAAWPDIERGFEKLVVFKNHTAYIPIAVTKAVSFHPIRTTQDSYAIYKAFTSEPVNYRAGGESSGDLLELLIEEMPTDQPVVQSLLKN